MKLLFIFLFLSVVGLCAYAGIPPYYYDNAEDLFGAELKTELHQIICNDTTEYLSYGSGIGHTWEGFYLSDRDSTTNAVIDMYSAIIRYYPDPNPDFASFGQEIHIEHSFPKSWWGGTSLSAYTDLHHLYPADGSTNLSKSNCPLGEVTGTISTDNGVSKIGDGVYENYDGNVFEPADTYKGDFARSYFYIVTAYENYYTLWDSPMLENNTFPVFNDWAIEMLLEWHRHDPVSDKERKRTEVVFLFQNNRNPFIDHPELAEHIWGNQTQSGWTQIENLLSTPISEVDVIVNQNNRTIVVKSQKDKDINVNIYNTFGGMVFSIDYKTNASVLYPAELHGIYIIEVKDEGAVIREKVYLD